MFLGSLNPCQGGLGHLCSENWSSNGICSNRPGNELPQRARLNERGGGYDCYLGNAQIEGSFFQWCFPMWVDGMGLGWVVSVIEHLMALMII